MQHQTLAPTPIPNRPFVAGLRDGLLLALLARTTGRKLRGRLLVRLPSGKARTIGSGHNLAQVHFLTFSAITACMRRGPLGFAEAYLDGAIEVSDLGAVFRFFIDNRAQLAAAGRGAFKARAFDRMGHAERANTRSGSKRNIEEHYDLGNAFYALWLDASMSYSSALFVEPGMSLEDGQAAKYEAILDALDLQPGHDVLEIGCGWVAFSQA
ncbi:MAG: class I SAM-dependent methyltransferase, partial [Pseudomonadota bacterium]